MTLRTCISRETDSGLIVGHIPQHGMSSPCCLNDRTWTPAGEATPFGPPRHEDGQLTGDPYYNIGYRQARHVVCGACGKPVNAHEYSRSNGYDSRATIGPLERRVRDMERVDGPPSAAEQERQWAQQDAYDTARMDPDLQDENDDDR